MDTRKVIIALYLAASMIFWFLVRTGTQTLYLSYYQMRRFPGITFLKEAIPVLFGVVLFVFFLRHKQVNLYLEDAVSEIKKVTWPGRTDVMKGTVVVIICILIASFILAFFDVVWGKMVTYLLY